MGDVTLEFLSRQIETMLDRQEAADAKLDRIAIRIGAIEERLGAIDRRLGAIETTQTALFDDLGRTEGRLTKRLDRLTRAVGLIEQDET